jgi:D-tyrosyl-tRNA(Tyr) deacylase
MRAVIQRVSRASVTVEGRVIGAIEAGLVVLLGVGHADTPDTAAEMAEKIVHLRIFPDERGKMNRSLLDRGLDTVGSLLAISQFTLYGDARRGRRPGFDQAAPPEQAAGLYEEFVRCVRARGVTTETGIFRADMSVNIVNEGPVTILLDSEKKF